jgi:hypothetical protein
MLTSRVLVLAQGGQWTRTAGTVVTPTTGRRRSGKTLAHGAWQLFSLALGGIWMKITIPNPIPMTAAMKVIAPAIEKRPILLRLRKKGKENAGRKKRPQTSTVNGLKGLERVEDA